MNSKLNNKTSIQPSKSINIKIVLGAVVIIIATTWVVNQLMLKDTSTFEYDSNSIYGMMPGVDRDALLAQMQEDVDSSSIAFSINSKPVVTNSEIDIFFENPNGNGKDLSIELFDNESGESIYQSKAVREGGYLQNISIEKKYTAGTHTVTAYITAYDIETHNVIGQAAAELLLTVAER